MSLTCQQVLRLPPPFFDNTNGGGGEQAFIRIFMFDPAEQTATPQTCFSSGKQCEESSLPLLCHSPDQK